MAAGRCVGRTCLPLSARKGDKTGEELAKAKAGIELLITRRADLNAKDYDGQTALSLAKEKGYKEIVALLRQHGAKK